MLKMDCRIKKIFDTAVFFLCIFMFTAQDMVKNGRNWKNMEIFVEMEVWK